MNKSDLYFLLNYESVVKLTIRVYEKLIQSLIKKYLEMPMPLLHKIEFERTKSNLEISIGQLQELLRIFKMQMECGYENK